MFLQISLIYLLTISDDYCYDNWKVLAGVVLCIVELCLEGAPDANTQAHVTEIQMLVMLCCDFGARRLVARRQQDGR
jgi:hypothetical protein